MRRILHYEEPKPIGKYRYMMLEKKQRLIDVEWDFFRQFAGDHLRRIRCDNCGAMFLHERSPSWRGRTICCAHCVFNPLGCRCKYGEFDVAEDRWY